MATQTQESTAAPEAKSAGLPQFDFQWWPGQIVWFLIMFLVVLVFVRLFAAPRVGGTIDAREDKISGDIADARRLKDEAEAQAAAAAAETAQARAAAQRVAAEARIATARDAAMANVTGIASDTAGVIVSKLTGKAATAAELTAARG